MITVYKYPFEIRDGIQVICTHEDYDVLLCEMQDHQPCLWLKVDLSRYAKELKIMVTGTGQPVPPNTAHFGSFQQGIFVWHVWRVG